MPCVSSKKFSLRLLPESEWYITWPPASITANRMRLGSTGFLNVSGAVEVSETPVSFCLSLPSASHRTVSGLPVLGDRNTSSPTAIGAGPRWLKRLARSSASKYETLALRRLMNGVMPFEVLHLTRCQPAASLHDT